MLSRRSIFPTLVKTVSAVALCAIVVCADAPRGWHISGANARGYDTGIDPTQYQGHRVAYLKAKALDTKSFGTLMQGFRADDYVGRQVRFSAMLKAEDVANWAGLWMRIDKRANALASRKILAIDNMQNRAVRGTEDWNSYQVVLDVPNEATEIYFGVVLNGPGNVLMTEPNIEIVGRDYQPIVKPTSASQPIPFGPTNLDFDR
jgi:hypothetical protein